MRVVLELNSDAIEFIDQQRKDRSRAAFIKALISQAKNDTKRIGEPDERIILHDTIKNF